MPELSRVHDDRTDVFDIGIDEAGRGPMLGRVYSAAVVVPADEPEFPYHLVKDSKRFSSAKKLGEVAEAIRQHSTAWAVAWEDEKAIDQMNIRRATHCCMHNAARSVIKSMGARKDAIQAAPRLLVDGNDFRPLVTFEQARGLVPVQHECIEKGDGRLVCIAAASILAKDARDSYIHELCDEDPSLDEKYNLRSNKGYGTQAHMEGLRAHGLSPYHRKSFGLCATLTAAGT